MSDILDPVFLARLQFAFTVSAHIIFPAFTIGLGSYLAVLEGLWLLTKDDAYLRVFSYWKTIFAVVFGMGVVSVRWSQLGFGRTSSTSKTQATPRNLFGFKDGTRNLKAEQPDQAIIFVRTKIGADRLSRRLNDAGVRVKALHGDMSQGQRDGVMIAFKSERERLLVATDVAARGLDIDCDATIFLRLDHPDGLLSHHYGRLRHDDVMLGGKGAWLERPSSSFQLRQWTAALPR